MNPQQEAVALWQFLESRGFAPSVAGVGRILRSQRPKIRFRESDLYAWLKPFSQIREGSRKSSADSPEEQIVRAGRVEPENGKDSGSRFARAVKVSLFSKNSVPTERCDPPRRARRMKQAAFALGPVSAPEVDYEKPSLSPPEDLPAEFPEANDDLLALAERFCRAFGGCKAEKAIKKHRAGYNAALASMRQRGTAVAVAWQAFTDALVANNGAPLFGHQARQAIAYLPSGRRPFKAAGPLKDDCGHELPPGVTMPRRSPGDRIHYAGDDEDGPIWIYGNACDPVAL